MPVSGAQPHTEQNLADVNAAVGPQGRPRPDPQTAQQVYGVQSDQQQKERVGRIGRGEVPRRLQLLPCNELTAKKCHGANARGAQAWRALDITAGKTVA